MPIEETKLDRLPLEIPDRIETERLILMRMVDAEDEAQLSWFHRIWSDEVCTSWSIQSATKSPTESAERMKQHQAKFNPIAYAVFRKPSPSTTPLPTPQDLLPPQDPGLLLGNIGLRQQPSPTLPPFPKPGDENANAKVHIRSLGYAYFTHAWGSGYATEAAAAILDAYAASVRSYLASKPRDQEGSGEEEEVFFVEGCWDQDNPASGRVLAKLGFREVGWYVEDTDELVFIGGKWRGPGYWVWGKYV